MYLHGYFVLPWGLRKKVVREKAWFLTIPAPYPFAMVISGARNTSWLAMAPPALTFTAFLKSPETEIKTKVRRTNRLYFAYIVTISWSLDETSSVDTHLSCINTTNKKFIILTGLFWFWLLFAPIQTFHSFTFLKLLQLSQEKYQYNLQY